MKQVWNEENHQTGDGRQTIKPDKKDAIAKTVSTTMYSHESWKGNDNDMTLFNNNCNMDCRHLFDQMN